MIFLLGIRLSSWKVAQSVSAGVACLSASDASKIYERHLGGKCGEGYSILAEEGQFGIPMQETFFATRFAQLRDSFGEPWTLVQERPHAEEKHYSSESFIGSASTGAVSRITR